MHVIGSFADCAIDRVMIASKLFAFCTLFALASEFATPTDFDQDEFPALIKDSFDMLRHVDNSMGRDDLVVPVHISIV